VQPTHHDLATWLKYGMQVLSTSSDSAKLDAEILLAFLLNKERTYLLTWPDKLLDEIQQQAFIQLLTRRSSGEPIAYIVGTKEFWSLPLHVSPVTLIPRPDTEVLVELVLNHYANTRKLHCLDLGTGTGAIALALASEQPLWQIDAVDYSFEAVKLAQHNAQSLHLNNVTVYQSDWFSDVKNIDFDVIVSNPPYIDVLDQNLSQGDVRFEPKSALVANEQGLGDIKFIAKQALKFLKPNGSIFFEHGYQQGRSVRDILLSLGYVSIQTVRDFNNHERITWAEMTDDHH
jgi:release factor glutamine methyltransferase